MISKIDFFIRRFDRRTEENMSPVTFHKPNICAILVDSLGHPAGLLVQPIFSALRSGIENCEEALSHANEGSEGGEIEIDYQSSIIEDLIGVAFVVCQTAITDVFSRYARLCDHVREQHAHAVMPSACRKRSVLAACSPTISTNGYTAIAAINALANYFKHSSEPGFWNPPAGKKAEVETIAILTSLGAKSGSTGNRRESLEALGIMDYKHIHQLVSPITDWTRCLYKTSSTALKDAGLLDGPQRCNK